MAVFQLHEHIAKEEDGLFPASLIALGGDEWDASIQAWHSAHPGDTMRPWSTTEFAVSARSLLCQAGSRATS